MNENTYRPEIDGLRAIAVVAVVLYHTGLGPRAGYLGVDIFFVISGYLITGHLHREWLVQGKIDFLAFYARRSRRILPALIVVVVTTFCAVVALLSPMGEQVNAAQSAAASLLFVSNIFFQANTGGYFDIGTHRLPFLHLWSLSVEEQFYLVWPISLMLLLRWRQAQLLSAISILALASLALAEWEIYRNPNAAFYQMTTRFWELAVGGLIAVSVPNQLSDGRVHANVGVVVMLVAILFPIDHFPGIGALPAVLGAGLYLHAVHGSKHLGLAGFWLTTRPMVFLGLISYSLYLWHWPLLVLGAAFHGGTMSIVTRGMLVAAAVGLAWLTFHLVERPTRRPDSQTTDARVILVGLLVSASLAFFVLVLADSLQQYPLPDDLASRARRDMPENRVQCNYRGDEALDVFPKPGCTSVLHKPVRVAIWGDSHALAWQPMAWLIAERTGVAATSYTRDACAPLLDYDNGKKGLEGKRCREFNALTVARVGSVDTLILVAKWPPRVAERNFEARFRTTLEQLAPAVRRIILVGPTPILRDAAPRCIESGNLEACTISRAEFDATADAARKMLIAAAAKYNHVEYVDPVDFFCDASKCPAVKDGFALFWDSNHVSTTAARNFSEKYFASDGKPRVK